MLSLAGFFSKLAIGCLSSSIYDLICFNSITQSGENEAMVQITKVKKNWLTSVHCLANKPKGPRSKKKAL